MAAKLQKLRLGLVNSCELPLVKDLTDHLHDARILSDAEVEHIEGINQLRDKIRALVDMVKKKGDRSSEFLIQKVSEIDPELSDKLGITVVLPMPTQEQNGSSSSQQDVHPLPIQEGSDSSSSQPVEDSQSTQSDSLHSQPESNKVQKSSWEKKQAIKPEIHGVQKCSDEDYKRITLQENIYPIRKGNERKRLALIICNTNFLKYETFKRRDGAGQDISKMEELLKELGYKVQRKTDLSVEEMQETMKKFSKEEDHKTSDSTFIVIMSHGLRDCICGRDTELKDGKPDKVLHIDEIFKTFNNVNCPALQDKPKVIIIQACRGDMESRVLVSDGIGAPSSEDTSALSSDGNTQSNAVRTVQREHDFVCFCSTTPDTKSWRDPSRGSLFIQKLIKEIKADAYRYSLQDIFLNVQASFKNEPQMPTLERTTLLKKFYLFPGH